MAKCDLSIELDEPERVHVGGGTITGVVHVCVETGLNCNGLEVMSGWHTQGCGDVASEIAGSATLFSGQWNAGEKHAYRFELPIAEWPPSYAGHDLNVVHCVEAQANILWASDPKTRTPFQVRSSRGPTRPKTLPVPTKASRAAVRDLIVESLRDFGIGERLIAIGLTGLVFFIFVLPCVAGIIKAAPVPVFTLLVFLGVSAVAVVCGALPDYRRDRILGVVQYEISGDRFCPGQKVSGEMVIRPRKDASIAGVTMELLGREECLSEIGDSKKMHQHYFFAKSESLQEPTTLSAGKEYRYALELTLPDDAFYSMDLKDNALIWSVRLRISMQKRPDWVEEIPLWVVPQDDQAAPESLPRHGPARLESDELTDAGLTFGETAIQVWKVRDNREQLEAIVEAVAGLTFELEAVVQRRLLSSSEDDPHLEKGERYAVWAHYPDPKLPLVSYVSHDLADEFEQTNGDVWRGLGTIVGWDSRQDRLQVKLGQPQRDGSVDGE